MADLIPLAYDYASGVPVGFKEYTSSDRIPALYLTAQPPNLYGTYAARPVANTVPSGTLYSASDTKEIYLSNGSVWSRAGINSARIASAERTTPYSTTSSTLAAVPGMTVQVTAGEVPAGVQYGGTMNYGSTTNVGLMALYCDGAQIGQILVGITNYTSYAAYATLPAKTPGTLVTLEIRASSSNNSSTFNIFGDPTDKPYMRVVSN
jgi:hypothetical protein